MCVTVGIGKPIGEGCRIAGMPFVDKVSGPTRAPDQEDFR